MSVGDGSAGLFRQYKLNIPAYPDWTGSQIGNNDSMPHPRHPTASSVLIIISLDSDDVRDIDLTKCHNLSGPIAVEGAEPGDCLVVDILDGELPSVICFMFIILKPHLQVNYYEKMPWGYSVGIPYRADATIITNIATGNL